MFSIARHNPSLHFKSWVFLSPLFAGLRELVHIFCKCSRTGTNQSWMRLPGSHIPVPVHLFYFVFHVTHLTQWWRRRYTINSFCFTKAWKFGFSLNSGMDRGATQQPTGSHPVHTTPQLPPMGTTPTWSICTFLNEKWHVPFLITKICPWQQLCFQIDIFRFCPSTVYKQLQMLSSTSSNKPRIASTLHIQVFTQTSRVPTESNLRTGQFVSLQHPVYSASQHKPPIFIMNHFFPRSRGKFMWLQFSRSHILSQVRAALK